MSELVLHQIKSISKVSREINAIITIVARDVLLALKSPSMLIMSLAMPLVMMGMLGGSLAQNMAGGLGFNYGQFMLVGMLVNMLFMTTTMGLTSLVDDHETDFTQEMMISPVSRYAIVIGKIFGSSFGAFVSMFGTLVVGLVIVYAGTPEYDSVVLFNPFLNFIAIAELTLVCLIIGTFFFARSEKNR